MIASFSLIFSFFRGVMMKPKNRCQLTLASFYVFYYFFPKIPFRINYLKKQEKRLNSFYFLFYFIMAGGNPLSTFQFDDQTWRTIKERVFNKKLIF